MLTACAEPSATTSSSERNDIASRADGLTSTDKTSYAAVDSVVVTFSGASGNAQDWISLSAPGSASTSYLVWAYTGGGTSGTKTFTGVPAGTLVARLHPYASYSVTSESAQFTMAAGASAITPDATSYAGGANVTLTFSGATNSPNDWVSISAPGSTNDSYVTYEYTGGGLNGTRVLANVPAGTWVARLHPNGNYATIAESAQFTMAAGQTSITTTTTEFATGASVNTTVTGMPGNARDWVSISAPNSPNDSYVAWAYTNGFVDGSLSFSGVADGSYVARAHPYGSYSILNESNAFTVGGAGIAPGSPAAASAWSWSSLASGGFHTCGIKGDGSLWCWGLNTYGELGNGTNTDVNTPKRVGAGTTWNRVAVGTFHTCATKTDGTLWCWGYNAQGELGDASNTDRYAPVQVGSATTWNSVTAGSYHTCGTLTAGSLWCWGYNAYSQLGDGTTADKNAPLQIGAVVTWSQLSAGWMHTCGVRTDKTLWCWGYNATGQIGDGTTVTKTAPTQIAGTIWGTVAVGQSHSCATRTDKTVWCWGLNTNGQVGDNTTVQKNAPTQTGSTQPWTNITVGAYHSCATQENGTLWCWGYNQTGQLGDNTKVDKLVPTPSHVARITQPALGWSHSCAIQQGGRLLCWGENVNGALGDGTLVDKTLPVRVGSGGVLGYSTFNGTAYGMCAITTDGRLSCWGSCGDFLFNPVTLADDYVPTYLLLNSDTDWAFMAQKSERPGQMCAIKTDGTLWCWARNNYGQVGDGTTVYPTSPKQIGTATWQAVTLGESHTCGIQTDGTLWCWGYNLNSRLGDGTTVDKWVPTKIGVATNWRKSSAGNSHTCGIQADGSLWCWGLNSNGQLGTGNTTTQTAPFHVGTATWTDVAAGDAHTIGVQTGNMLYTWGYNLYGQLGNGTTSFSNTTSPTRIGTATDWLYVGARNRGGLAVRTTGQLWSWGNNAYGDVGDGTTTNRTAPVQIGAATNWSLPFASQWHACALRSDLTAYCWGRGGSSQHGQNNPVDISTASIIPNPI